MGKGNITNLGKLLRVWRDKKGVTMDEMAWAIGISYQTLSKIELGHRKCSQEISDKIIAYFALSDEQIEVLSTLVDKNNGYVKIEVFAKAESDQEIIKLFAKKYIELTDDKKEEIRRILNERNFV